MQGDAGQYMTLPLYFPNDWGTMARRRSQSAHSAIRIDKWIVRSAVRTAPTPTSKRVPSNGLIDAYAARHDAELILDITGYFAL
jgi:hypothetical protein